MRTLTIRLGRQKNQFNRTFKGGLGKALPASGGPACASVLLCILLNLGPLILGGSPFYFIFLLLLSALLLLCKVWALPIQSALCRVCQFACSLLQVLHVCQFACSLRQVLFFLTSCGTVFLLADNVLLWFCLFVCAQLFIMGLLSLHSFQNPSAFCDALVLGEEGLA